MSWSWGHSSRGEPSFLFSLEILIYIIYCMGQIIHHCGLFFQFNEIFEYKCQDCVCEESTKAVSCKPKVCPPPAIANCSGPGFVLVNQTSPGDPCCSTFICRKTCSIKTYLCFNIFFTLLFDCGSFWLCHHLCRMSI